MTRLETLKKHLLPGHVYRRQDLAQWSKAVDRHIKQLLDEGTLTKLSGGLYLRAERDRLRQGARGRRGAGGGVPEGPPLPARLAQCLQHARRRHDAAL